MHTFCFLFTIFLSHDFGRTKEIIYKILVGLRNKDPIRVFPGGGGGGGGILPYISYIGMCRLIGRVFAPFWSENESTLCPFWSGIGYGFRRNSTGVYERIYRFNCKRVRKKDKYANSN